MAVAARLLEPRSAGQKADALSGYSNIASQSLSKATSDAQKSLSDRQAVGQLVGAAGGMAARNYGVKDVSSKSTYGLKDVSSKSTGIFGGS